MNELREFQKTGALPGPAHPVRKGFKRDPVEAHKTAKKFHFLGWIVIVAGLAVDLGIRSKLTLVILILSAAGTLSCFAVWLWFERIVRNFCRRINLLCNLLGVSPQKLSSMRIERLQQLCEHKLVQLAKAKIRAEKKSGLGEPEERRARSKLADAFKLCTMSNLVARPQEGLKCFLDLAAN